MRKFIDGIKNGNRNSIEATVIVGYAAFLLVMLASWMV